jgi:FKBP-type peptidyl-prolyl cis-trans isomerase
MNIANNLKTQGITSVNSASLNKGMNDIFNSKSSTLTDQQANMCIQQKLQSFAAKKNEGEKEKGKAFLEANKKRAGVITLPSGLQYEVVKAGDANSPMPKKEDTVVANYAGTLTNGKEFDNSYKRGQPLTIPVGGVIKGWTEALQLMHIGDKWKVYIPSELGYGERGAGADIPGGATLVFEMELLGIKPAGGAAPIGNTGEQTTPKKD